MDLSSQVLSRSTSQLLRIMAFVNPTPNKRQRERQKAQRMKGQYNFSVPAIVASK